LVWAYSANSFAFGIQAADGSAHYACIDHGGFANFDESPSADATACNNNYSYGYANYFSRGGLSSATSDGNNNQSFDNTAHADVSGNYIFKDGDGYCWDVTWDGSSGSVYTAVVEATYANYPDYAGVCANISAPTAPVSASVNSPLGLLLAMLGVAGIAGFLRRRQKKITH